MSSSKPVLRQPVTSMVPVTTMEEVVLPTDAEREDMRRSLDAAQAEIKAGHFVEYDPATFVDRLTTKPNARTVNDPQDRHRSYSAV